MISRYSPKHREVANKNRRLVEQVIAATCSVLCITLSAAVFGSPPPGTTIVCSELDDRDQTRVVIELGASVYELKIITPEFLWNAPDQPETPRFPEGKTDVSPNLAGWKNVEVTPVTDPDGRLRIIDFAVLEPDALELEGLRGSLVLHESFLNNQAFASLFYTATGNLVSLTPLVCVRFPSL